MVDSSVASVVVPIVLILVFIIVSIYMGICVVREREVMVIERFGKFNCVLVAGVHFIIPFVDRPKRYNFRYWVENASMNGSNFSGRFCNTY